jgi:hypothetical protein
VDLVSALWTGSWYCLLKVNDFTLHFYDEHDYDGIADETDNGLHVYSGA